MTNFQMELRWETAAFARFIYGQAIFDLSTKSVMPIFQGWIKGGAGKSIFSPIVIKVINS